MLRAPLENSASTKNISVAYLQGKIGESQAQISGKSIGEYKANIKQAPFGPSPEMWIPKDSASS
jgi:hypothetical protein